MHIRGYCHQIIRESEPRLSTGAYGDEGKVLLELNEMFNDIMRGNEVSHIEFALAWRGNFEIEMAGPGIRDTIAYLVSTIAVRTKPMRLTMSQEDINEVKLDLFHRLDAFSAEPHALFKKIFARYWRVMENQDVVEMVRGGDEWLLLHRYDLLACLGPWIVEVEGIREDAVEGAA